MDHRHHHHKSLTKMLLNHQYMSIDQSYRKEIFFFQSSRFNSNQLLLLLFSIE